MKQLNPGISQFIADYMRGQVYHRLYDAWLINFKSKSESYVKANRPFMEDGLDTLAAIAARDLVIMADGVVIQRVFSGTYQASSLTREMQDAMSDALVTHARPWKVLPSHDKTLIMDNFRNIVMTLPETPVEIAYLIVDAINKYGYRP